MKRDAQDLAQLYLQKAFEALNRHEQEVVRRIAGRVQIARNIHADHDAGLTFGQRLADRVAAFGGSWTFIFLFSSVIVGWVFLNTYLLLHREKAFDPYPFILLNLLLSMVAALQAPVIMMSQNRQSAKDRLQAEHDYEVNLKAEIEIMALHQKIDLLRETQWGELVAMQREQIEMLRRLVERLQTRGEC